MRTYMYFSGKFNCDVKMTFNSLGFLIAFEVVNPDEIKEVKANPIAFPTTLESFLTNATAKKIKLIELERAVSFDMFWQKYNLKDSGRKKAEEAWNKHTKEEQIKAFDYVTVLDRKLKMGAIAKPYATTYLNQKRWEQ